MFPIESFQAALGKFTTVVNTHNIRFHLTGGITGTAYGEPRMTQDIDVVIDPISSRKHVDVLIDTLSESDFLFSEPAARNAIGKGDMFQLLDQRECLKLDIYPRELIPGELDRSEELEIFAGVLLPVVSRVDAAASKLVLISKGSHKSRRDLRAITRKCTDKERVKINEHAVSFELVDLLTEVLSENDEIL